MAMNNKGRDSHNSDRGSQSNRNENLKGGSNRKNVSQNLNEDDDQDLRSSPTRKPGSQSNSSKQSNNGRGGGK